MRFLAQKMIAPQLESIILLVIGLHGLPAFGELQSHRLRVRVVQAEPMMEDQAPELESLASAIARWRPLLLWEAQAHVGTGEADDVLQAAFCNLNRTYPGRTRFPVALLRRTVTNAAKDLLRTRRAAEDLRERLTRSGSRDQEVGLDATVNQDSRWMKLLGRLSDTEATIVRLRVSEQRPHAEIAAITGYSHTAVRKIFQRARHKLAVHGIEELLRLGDLDSFNTMRLTDSLASAVARRCRPAHQTIESLYAAFEQPALNVAIKNATLVLTHLLPRDRGSSRNSVEERLLTFLKSDDLYRGQKMYIADALIDANLKRSVYEFQRTFLKPALDMQDRPARRTLTKSEMADPDPVSLADLKPIKLIGRDISPRLVGELRQYYSSGRGSIDLRRCLSFELLRIQPDNELIRMMVRSLFDEPDLTNACYVIKQLSSTPMACWTSVDRQRLGDAIEALARRWPENAFLNRMLEHKAS